MTYLYHKNGTLEIMIHQYRWKHCLSADQFIQISEIFIQSRIIKKTKALLYLTEWKMFQQNGSFSSIDTCDHVSFGHFDKPSILRFEVEIRAIFN